MSVSKGACSVRQQFFPFFLTDLMGNFRGIPDMRIDRQLYDKQIIVT